MRKILFTGFICVLLTSAVFAQKSKPWTEWSKKDADRMLNDSAWGQSQTKGEGPAVISKSASETRSTQANMPTDQTGINFRVRFITARPIREAFGRKILLEQPNAPKELQDGVQAFVDRDFGDIIVVGVNVDGQDARMVGGVLQGLARLTVASLNEKVFLERKDGKRLQLTDYRAPVADNMGAKFFFPRSIDGQPFLAADGNTVRFVLILPNDIKLDVKFKVANMMSGEKLEY